MKRNNKKSIKNPDTFNENETPRIDHAGSSICRLDDIKKSFKILINNENNPVYNNLKEELSKTKHLQDAFRHYYNAEGDIGNATK